MTRALPKQLDPLALAKRAAHISGHVPLIELERVLSVVNSNEGDVTVELQFGYDKEGRSIVTGEITAVLELVCQRCLAPVPITVSSTLSLYPVFTVEQAKEVPNDYDPIILNDEQRIVLADLIEDELLLALPIVAKHDVVSCKLKQQDETPLKTEPKENPFACLKHLKSAKRDK